ncbi:MAG: glycosyltransferase [Ignavibacteriaceae bacterium]|nr:glycosyltransferase [Ignavibacteriaceae bacterium]
MRDISNVTVLMTVYNGAEYVSRAIHSILIQTYKEFQFLIIDDGSTDNTKEVIHSFKDPRINYHYIPNSGLGTALNYGLGIAKYDWIARMDADDISHPQRLEKQIMIAVRNDFDVISCQYAVFEEERIRYVILSSEHHPDIKKRLAIHNEISHPGVLFNRQTIINSGGYYPGVFEDFELWLRIKDRVKFYILPEVLIFLNLRMNSYSRTDSELRRKEVYDILAPYYNSDLTKEFGIKQEENNIIRGWREFIYGDKIKAREYWSSTPFNYLGLRILTAYMLTFFPTNFILKFQKCNLRFRINYLISYFYRHNRSLRRTFFGLINIS